MYCASIVLEITRIVDHRSFSVIYLVIYHTVGLKFEKWCFKKYFYLSPGGFCLSRDKQNPAGGILPVVYCLSQNLKVVGTKIIEILVYSRSLVCHLRMTFLRSQD